MADEKVVVLNENYPAPLRALDRIKQHSYAAMGKPQIPDAEDEELFRAHNAVSAWLTDLERMHRYPSVAAVQPTELHPGQAQFGVCPECHANDGYLVGIDDVWVVCHRHRVRWPVTGRELGATAQVMHAGLLPAEEVRVAAYAVVQPTWLPGFGPKPELEPKVRTAGHLALVEDEESHTQGMVRVWRDRHLLQPGVYPRPGSDVTTDDRGEGAGHTGVFSARTWRMAFDAVVLFVVALFILPAQVLQDVRARY